MTVAEKNTLRRDAQRLFGCEDISATKDMLNILSECLFKIFNENRNMTVKDLSEADSKVISQMIFSKTVSLTKMMDGFTFKSLDNYTLKNTIDPTVIAVLVRNIFETVAMFNLIFIYPQNTDEKKVLYNLWVTAGLKFRQRFASKITTPENIQKQKNEEATINNLQAEIHQTQLFKSLSKAGQKTINNKIKEKDFKIKFEGQKVIPISWQDLIPLMGVNESLMGDMYTYFSLYAHPSNVSVFQFGNLFSKNDPHYLDMTKFNVLNATKLISFFVADFIKCFPDTIDSFNKLPILYQIVINWHSSFLRNDNATINDAISNLI